MSAILDLDQIACSGNGVVSDKWVLPALTHLTGSLQQRVLVQIGKGGVVWGGVVVHSPQRQPDSSWLWRGKKRVGVFPGSLVTTCSRQLRFGGFLSAASC